MKLLLATRNRHKAAEISAILRSEGLQLPTADMMAGRLYGIPKLANVNQ